MVGENLTVREVMTAKVKAVAANDALEDVHRLMRLAGIRHAPVVENGKLVGVVSERDLLLGWSRNRRMPIAEVMTRTPRYVRPEDDARDAARVMLRYKIGCLPVVDAALAVIGIVTEADFVALAARLLAGEPAAEDRSGASPS